MNQEDFKDFRCSECGKLFFKGILPKAGKIEIKCSRCKKINNFKGSGEHEEISEVLPSIE